MTELGDIVAEHENRISFLENSLPGSAMSYHPEDKPQEEPRDLNETERPEQGEKYKRIDRIVREFYQLKNEVSYLHNELYEVQKLLGLHGETPGKKHKPKYKEYTSE